MLSSLARLRLTATRVSAALQVRHFGELQLPSALVRKAQSELEEEKKVYQPDPMLAAFIKETEFKLVEQDFIPLVKLRKETPTTIVDVNFEARSQPPENEEGEGEEKGEEEKQMGNFEYVDFQVIVRRPGKEGGLLFECISFNGEMQIVRVTFVDNAEELLNSKHIIDMLSYKGPDFMTLKEKTQKIFLDYLHELGIDEDLVGFISSYSVDKEQRLYLRWLEELKSLAVVPSK